MWGGLDKGESLSGSSDGGDAAAPEAAPAADFAGDDAYEDPGSPVGWADGDAAGGARYGAISMSPIVSPARSPAGTLRGARPDAPDELEPDARAHSKLTMRDFGFDNDDDDTGAAGDASYHADDVDDGSYDDGSYAFDYEDNAAAEDGEAEAAAAAAAAAAASFDDEPDESDAAAWRQRAARLEAELRAAEQSARHDLADLEDRVQVAEFERLEAQMQVEDVRALHDDELRIRVAEAEQEAAKRLALERQERDEMLSTLRSSESHARRALSRVADFDDDNDDDGGGGGDGGASGDDDRDAVAALAVVRAEAAEGRAAELEAALAARENEARDAVSRLEGELSLARAAAAGEAARLRSRAEAAETLAASGEEKMRAENAELRERLSNAAHHAARRVWRPVRRAGGVFDDDEDDNEDDEVEEDDEEENDDDASGVSISFPESESKSAGGNSRESLVQAARSESLIRELRRELVSSRREGLALKKEAERLALLVERRDLNASSALGSDAGAGAAAGADPAGAAAAAVVRTADHSHARRLEREVEHLKRSLHTSRELLRRRDRQMARETGLADRWSENLVAQVHAAEREVAQLRHQLRQDSNDHAFTESVARIGEGAGGGGQAVRELRAMLKYERAQAAEALELVQAERAATDGLKERVEAQMRLRDEREEKLRARMEAAEDRVAALAEKALAQGRKLQRLKRVTKEQVARMATKLSRAGSAASPAMLSRKLPLGSPGTLRLRAKRLERLERQSSGGSVVDGGGGAADAGAGSRDARGRGRPAEVAVVRRAFAGGVRDDGDELLLEEGCEVEVIERRGGWCRGRRFDRPGWFPEAHIHATFKQPRGGGGGGGDGAREGGAGGGGGGGGGDDDDDDFAFFCSFSKWQN